MTYMTVCKAEFSTFIKNCHVIKRILPFVTVIPCLFAAFSQKKYGFKRCTVYWVCYATSRSKAPCMAALDEWNITKDGIAKDLSWIKRSGIGGFQNFDESLMTPQIIDKRLTYMTPEWKDAFLFTKKLADSLKLEMANHRFSRM